MAVSLVSTGIKFSDNVIQTDVGVADVSKPVFKGYYKNDLDISGSSGFPGKYYPPMFGQSTNWKMPINFAIYDTHSGLNGTDDNWYYQIPVAGWYWISVRIGLQTPYWFYLSNLGIGIKTPSGSDFSVITGGGGTGDLAPSISGGYYKVHSRNYTEMVYLESGARVAAYAWGQTYAYGPQVKEAFLNVYFIRT